MPNIMISPTSSSSKNNGKSKKIYMAPNQTLAITKHDIEPVLKEKTNPNTVLFKIYKNIKNSKFYIKRSRKNKVVIVDFEKRQYPNEKVFIVEFVKIKDVIECINCESHQIIMEFTNDNGTMDINFIEP